tara:strand:+ start:2439 stop:2858 length:420 start_codon:yes stop_codon:yes gene_type:complete
MSSITDDFVEYYNKTIETLVLYYDNTIKFIEDNSTLFVVLLIILLLVFFSNVSPTTTYNIVNFIDTNLSIIFAIIIMTLIFYILYVFYDKSSEYNDLKSFVGSRTEKLDNIINNVNTNNTNFVKNDVEVCKKLKNTGSA